MVSWRFIVVFLFLIHFAFSHKLSVCGIGNNFCVNVRVDIHVFDMIFLLASQVCVKNILRFICVLLDRDLVT